MQKKKQTNKISKQALSLGAIAAITTVPTNLSAEQVETTTVEKGQEMTETSKTKASVDYTHFEDAKLQSAINEELGQAADAEISVTQMESLKSLSLANKGITDDYGLQDAKNLVNLDLSGNELTTYTNVSQLPNLETLNLSNNKIRTFYTTKDNLKIKNINLSNNDISYLSNNEYNLNNGSVDLSNNNIYLVNDEFMVNNCTYLNLEGNSINDFSDFAAISKNTEINFNNQVITLEDFQVTDNEPVYTIVTTVQGETLRVNLGVPKFGTFEYSIPIELEIDSVNKTKTTVTFKGKVTYEGFLVDSAAQSNLGKKLSDEELLSLFNVTGSYADGSEMLVSVDQSNVNYNLVGVYTVYFNSTASNGETIRRSASLEIMDPEESNETTGDNSNETTSEDNSSNEALDTPIQEDVPTQKNTTDDTSSKSEDTQGNNTSASTSEEINADSQNNSNEDMSTDDNTDESSQTLANTGITTNTGIILALSVGLASLIYVRSRQK